MQTVKKLPGTAPAAINLGNRKDRVVSFDIRIKPTNRFMGLLQRIGVMPQNRRFEVGPVTGRNAKRIAAILEGIKLEKPATDAMLLSSIAATCNLDALAWIVAIGMTNEHEPPPEALAAFLLDSLSSQELSSLFEIILMQVSLPSVLASLLLGKGMNIMQEPTGEIAAPAEAATAQSSPEAVPDGNANELDLSQFDL